MPIIKKGQTEKKNGARVDKRADYTALIHAGRNVGELCVT
jgi:hypothetical protein